MRQKHKTIPAFHIPWPTGLLIMLLARALPPPSPGGASIFIRKENYILHQKAVGWAGWLDLLTSFFGGSFIRSIPIRLRIVDIN
uniref:Secreted protein n=1 Tax=Anopheles darlingi TaxID=43151 RepID=A0A2M4DAN5_ANODA